MGAKLALVRSHFHWPTIAQDTRLYVSSCGCSTSPRRAGSNVPCQTRLYSKNKKMTAFELLVGRKPRTSLDSLVPLLHGATQTTSVPARLNPVRLSGRIGQSNDRHYLAGGSKQCSDPCQRTTAQALPKLSDWNLSHYNRERTLRIRA